MSNEILTFNWDDLDEHFDDEKDIIELDASVTLDEVWTAFDKNNIAAIQQWIAKDLLRAISDDTANAWFDSNQLLNALETDEWILLQVAPVTN